MFINASVLFHSVSCFFWLNRSEKRNSKIVPQDLQRIWFLRTEKMQFCHKFKRKTNPNMAWIRWETCTCIEQQSLLSPVTCDCASFGIKHAHHLDAVAWILLSCLDCCHCISAALQVCCVVQKWCDDVPPLSCACNNYTCFNVPGNHPSKGLC